MNIPPRCPERRYEKKHGTYYLMDGDRIVHAGDSIAAAFCTDSDGVVTLHKLGPVDSTKEWADKARKAWQSSGLADISGEISVLESDKWDVEDLNNILVNSSYMSVLLSRLNIKIEN